MPDLPTGHGRRSDLEPAHGSASIEIGCSIQVSDTDIRVEYGSVDETDWLYREIGTRIRNARLTADLTQMVLAHQAGLARTSITNIEKGNQQPTIHALWRIADAVGVSPCQLLPAWPSSSSDSEPYLPDDVPTATRAALLRIATGNDKGRT
jgi:transcriptional regulator with XRE-family HTH domain